MAEKDNNFAGGSVVFREGSVGPPRLYLQAADITTAATVPVTVFNPAPGGGTSGGINFTIYANLRFLPQRTTCPLRQFREVRST